MLAAAFTIRFVASVDVTTIHKLQNVGEELMYCRRIVLTRLSGDFVGAPALLTRFRAYDLLAVEKCRRYMTQAGCK